MRHFTILLLLAVASVLHAETYTNTFTATGSGTIVYITATPPLPSVPQTGTYTLAGTFVATMLWEYSPNGQNFVVLNTYTGTVGPVVMAQPGYYQWVCSAYTSGTVTSTIFKNYIIYQQQLSNQGTTLFQVDDSGFSGVFGSSFPTAKVANGGTGLTSMTAYALLAGGTTATGNLQQVSGLGTSGQVLTSNGTAALPTWQAGGSIAGSIASTQIAVGSGTNTIGGSANFTEALGQIYISSGASGNGLIDIDSPTAASSALEFTQNAAANKTFELYSSNTTTFSLYDIVSTEDTFVYSHTNQNWTLPLTTASSSTTTGALIDDGGLAVAGAEWIGGLLNVAGAGTIQGVLTAGGTTAPSANTFTGNKIWGGNTAAAYTAGQVGEVIESKVSTATNAGSTGAYLALTSITLTAGNWDISALAYSTPNGATFTPPSSVTVNIGTTSASSAGCTAGYDYALSGELLSAGSNVSVSIPAKRVQITASTAYYLNVAIQYTAGTPQWVGSITARRTP